MNLNELARQVHDENCRAGWWDSFPNKADRIPTARMLVVTELAEAAEGARKGLMDDHLPHLKMFDVELADAAIRLLDLAGALGVDVASRPHNLDALCEFVYGDKENDLERLDYIVGRVGYERTSLLAHEWIVAALHRIFALAEFHNIDLLDIIEQKRAYNAQRADHKPENRAKEGGKKL